jgi:hypothetical protein
MIIAQEHINDTGRVRGVTLLEVVIACTITAIVFTVVFVGLSKWTLSFEDNNTHAADNDRIRDVFARMCDEIRESGSSCPDWDLFSTSDTITFNRCTGSYGTGKCWGEAITYTFNTESGTLVRTSGEGSRTLCANVTSLSFTQDGNNVEITLEVSSTGKRGRDLNSRLSSLVSLRN